MRECWKKSFRDFYGFRMDDINASISSAINEKKVSHPCQILKNDKMVVKEECGFHKE